MRFSKKASDDFGQFEIFTASFSDTSDLVWGRISRICIPPLSVLQTLSSNHFRLDQLKNLKISLEVLLSGQHFEWNVKF
jgi:hypothetical protein